MKNRYKRKLIFVIAILSLSLVCCKSKTEPINNIASWTPDDGWTINGIDIRDDYANFILLYQDREIANVEISKFNYDEQQYGSRYGIIVSFSL